MDRGLAGDLRKWINEWRKRWKPFFWTKSAAEILETLSAQRSRFNELPQTLNVSRGLHTSQISFR